MWPGIKDTLQRGHVTNDPRNKQEKRFRKIPIRCATV